MGKETSANAKRWQRARQLQRFKHKKGGGVLGEKGERSISRKALRIGHRIKQPVNKQPGDPGSRELLLFRNFKSPRCHCFLECCCQVRWYESFPISQERHWILFCSLSLSLGPHTLLATLLWAKGAEYWVSQAFGQSPCEWAWKQTLSPGHTSFVESWKTLSHNHQAKLLQGFWPTRIMR